MEHAALNGSQPVQRSAEQDETLSPRNFQRLCEFVHTYCGIKLTLKKKSMLDGRLRRRMRALGIANTNEYCAYLFNQDAPEAQAELVHFIDAVTTNKTDFFREPAHFSILENRLLPAYRKAGHRHLKIWSAAASTGAEAYTIAMVIDHFFRDTGGFDYSILATDVCTDVLNKGMSALYSDTMIDPIPEDYRRRYVLVPNDPARREFRIAAKLRAKVHFQHLNLMEERYGVERDFDMIFLRNVLIYFDRQTQENVLAKLCEHLRPGGYLFLGHSESLSGARLPLFTIANTVFQRR